MYGINSCGELRDAFTRKPFQGQVPGVESARAIFLGLDANYSNLINSNADFLEILLRYHDNGVLFWEKDSANYNQKHHPFLLDSFPYDKRKDGHKYHRTFDKIGLTPAYAKYVSFLELLDVPTTNDAKPNDQISYEGLLRKSGRHLEYVRSIMAACTPKAIFLSSDVINRYNQAIRDFDIIKDDLLLNPPLVNNEPVLIRVRNRAELYKCYHFSIRKNNLEVHEHLRNIKKIVDRIIAI